MPRNILTSSLSTRARENKRRIANGEEILADNDALEESERPDILLDQAAQIVTDYAEALSTQATPVLTSSQTLQYEYYAINQRMNDMLFCACIPFFFIRS